MQETDSQIRSQYINSLIDKLPEKIKINRNKSINNAIEFITSSEFYENKIQGKNYKNKQYLIRLNTLLKDTAALKERADNFIFKIYNALEKEYKNKEDIVILWSGGRDTSTILAYSLAFFSNKNYKLLTAINGMSKNTANPNFQYKRLTARILNKETQPNIEHYYIDLTDYIQKHVIDSAREDKEKLGCPALCSSCKICMEKALANTAINNFSTNNIILGYTKYQGVQDWVEQTPEQIDSVKNSMMKYGVYTNSPLYDILEYPFDPILALASLSIPIEEQKIEMKCGAGGLNPRDLDKQKLITFLKDKNEKTSYILNDNVKLIIKAPVEDDSKYSSLVDEVLKLRADKEYRMGVFEEKKYGGA